MEEVIVLNILIYPAGKLCVCVCDRGQLSKVLNSNPARPGREYRGSVT